MELKNLWNLGEDKAKFLSKRGCRKRKKSQVKKKVSRKRRKLSDDKKSESLNLVKNSGSVKAKRKLPKETLPDNKKKSKKKEEEEMLPERFLYPDELIFEKFLFDRKGYRIDPIKRDGNCLFRAIAGAVYGDTDLYADVRKQCADFMEKEKEFFKPFVVQVIDHGDYVQVIDFDTYISKLRREGEWGGDPEITALCGIFNCTFEVYKYSEIPDYLHFPNGNGNPNTTFRLFYRNNHYNIVRSDGVGDQLFNFEGLEEGELERQMEILFNAGDPKNCSESEQQSSRDDQKLAHAIKLSLDEDDAEKNYKRFYASRIIKRNTNEQN